VPPRTGVNENKIQSHIKPAAAMAEETSKQQTRNSARKKTTQTKRQRPLTYNAMPPARHSNTKCRTPSNVNPTAV
jgi:hypothetical protein